jgi:hypothetical protein
MSENKNLRDQISRVAKMKETKQRNRDIKALKKESKKMLI